MDRPRNGPLRRAKCPRVGRPGWEITREWVTCPLERPTDGSRHEAPRVIGLASGRATRNKAVLPAALLHGSVAQDFPVQRRNWPSRTAVRIQRLPYTRYTGISPPASEGAPGSGLFATVALRALPSPSSGYAMVHPATAPRFAVSGVPFARRKESPRYERPKRGIHCPRCSARHWTRLGPRPEPAVLRHAGTRPKDRRRAAGRR